MNASPTSTFLRPRPGLDLTDAVPNARFVLIPDAGHLPKPPTRHFPSSTRSSPTKPSRRTEHTP